LENAREQFILKASKQSFFFSHIALKITANEEMNRPAARYCTGIAQASVGVFVFHFFLFLGKGKVLNSHCSGGYMNLHVCSISWNSAHTKKSTSVYIHFKNKVQGWGS
jgi:hypothetical protein